MKIKTLMRLLSIFLLALSAHAGVVYQFDDGTAENAVAAGGAAFFWLNQFTVQAGGETIDTVRLTFGYSGCGGGCGLTNGDALTVYLWSDPNQDGNPADAQVLSSLATTMSSVNTGSFVTYLLTPVTLAVGDKFFAGAGMGAGPVSAAASLDTDTNSGLSWAAVGSNPNALNSGLLATIGGFGYPGNWLVRAESTDAGGEVPEPATWSLLAAGGLGLFLRRRK